MTDFETSVETTSYVAQLQSSIEELKKENDNLVLKGLALILLVPDGTTLGEIQKSYERVATMPARIAALEAALNGVLAAMSNVTMYEDSPVYRALLKARAAMESKDG